MSGVSCENRRAPGALWWACGASTLMLVAISEARAADTSALTKEGGTIGKLYPVAKTAEELTGAARRADECAAAGGEVKTTDDGKYTFCYVDSTSGAGLGTLDAERSLDCSLRAKLDTRTDECVDLYTGERWRRGSTPFLAYFDFSDDPPGWRILRPHVASGTLLDAVVQVFDLRPDMSIADRYPRFHAPGVFDGKSLIEAKTLVLRSGFPVTAHELYLRLTQKCGYRAFGATELAAVRDALRSLEARMKRQYEEDVPTYGKSGSAMWLRFAGKFSDARSTLDAMPTAHWFAFHHGPDALGLLAFSSESEGTAQRVTWWPITIMRSSGSGSSGRFDAPRTSFDPRPDADTLLSFAESKTFCGYKP